jgi:glycosyltransferase involved in cell wall biosynthesis
MKVLLWHVHGSWTTAFVRGGHDYVVPVTADRGPYGRGRARTWDWPTNVVELPPESLAHEHVDAIILQRPEEERLAAEWLRRRPGPDIPFIYLEHNAPQGRISELRHPMADRRDLTLVHVTHFNALFWDAGTTPQRVIEHGVVDPGYDYTGELARAAVVVNEPVRRGRVTGTDLLPALDEAMPIDLFGMGARAAAPALGVHGFEDLPQVALHREVARRRVYLHPVRWTSLGLSLIEAMQLGMPVVALATTAVPEAVPPEAGVVSNDPAVIGAALRHLHADPEEARRLGKAGRAAALERFGLDRFLDDWDRLLKEVTK